jgi:indolepyruvate ferredoxin oxidoreductase beta subunit
MKKQNVINVTFGGIGGQGIIKASELLGWAALYDGFHVKKSEVHGMAQRGGSVESHVRFGSKIYSPRVGPAQADYVLCFHADEHERVKTFLKKDGVDLAGFLEKAQAIIENPKHLNTVLVGVLAAYLQIRSESWLKAMETVFSPKILAENQAVFEKGKALVKP